MWGFCWTLLFWKRQNTQGQEIIDNIHHHGYSYEPASIAWRKIVSPNGSGYRGSYFKGKKPSQRLEKNILVHAPGLCWYASGVFSVSQNFTLPETKIVPENRPRPKRKGERLPIMEVFKVHSYFLPW